jgi:6,7-dimethyl-8-ribityllumazine synthase
MTDQEGKLDASGRCFAIAASRFNDFVVEGLLKGARDTLLELGAGEDSIEVYQVPGAFEIPAIARKLVEENRFDAVICLGAVIRGETPHFDYVAGESARELAHLAARSPIPVIYGILTTDTIEQALDRIEFREDGNKGSYAARAAVEMADLFAGLKGSQAPDA